MSRGDYTRPPLRRAPARAGARRARRRGRGDAAAARARARGRGGGRASCAPWIERRRRALPRARAPRSPRAPGTVPYLGRRPAAASPQPGRTRAHRRGDLLLVPGGDDGARRSSAGTGARRAPRSPRAWTRRRARAGTRYTRLTIRDQRTRWASCSATGAMSFNWRLLLAPEAVLDYVV